MKICYAFIGTVGKQNISYTFLVNTFFKLSLFSCRIFDEKMFRSGFLLSHKSYLIMLLYRWKTNFTTICTLLKNLCHFHTKYTMFCWIAKKNFTSANQSTNQVPYLDIFYSRQIIFIDTGHQRRTSFNQKFDMKTIIFLKNVIIKKGVEYF
jgi:hypothetical protein